MKDRPLRCPHCDGHLEGCGTGGGALIDLCWPFFAQCLRCSRRFREVRFCATMMRFILRRMPVDRAQPRY